MESDTDSMAEYGDGDTGEFVLLILMKNNRLLHGMTKIMSEYAWYIALVEMNFERLSNTQSQSMSLYDFGGP